MILWPLKRGVTFSISILSGVVIALAVQAGVRSVAALPAFAVQEVEVLWPRNPHKPAQRYKMIPPVSIFKVNLKAVTEAIHKENPSAEVQSVRRVLPNRIVAVLHQRQIVAQVKEGTVYYPVSEIGTVILEPRKEPWGEAPLFAFERLRGPFTVGQTLDHADFWAAYDLLGAVQRQPEVNRDGVAGIRCRRRDVLLTMRSGLEVRFASDRMENGWRQFIELVAQRPEILTQARYVDLRFDEPVLGGMKKPPRGKAKR